jgi:hypothetical protein
VICDFSSRTKAVRHVHRHSEMRLCHTPRRYCSRHPERVTEHRPVEGCGCTRKRWSTSSRPRTTKTIRRASRYSKSAPRPLCQAVMRHSDFPEFTVFRGRDWSYLTHGQPEPGRWRGSTPAVTAG